MGGPMYTLATLSPDSKYLYLASGYAFAPEFGKREFLRETEGIIKSIQFKEAEKK